MSSTKRRRTKYAGGPWLGYVIHGLRCNDWHGLPVTRQTHRERLDIGRSLATQDAISTAIERALWSSIQALGMLREILIVSDDTAQFAVDRHVLCEMHTERVVHRLVTFTNPRRVPQNHVLALIWRLYDHLKEYHADPLARRLSRFDHIFRRCTRFVALGRLLMRLRTDKPASLMALDRPEIPLQTNGSGRDICLPVIKCKISGGTRSLDGHACHDAYPELMRTAARLGISFWGSLGDWLSIPGQRNAQYLPDLSAVAAGPHEPRTFLLRRRSVERLGGHRHRGMTTAE